MGYKLALQNSKPDCINRVILCSDGVANVGQTGSDGILKEIRTYVEDGVTLTTVGFGMGNYNDILMEELANNGNGSYAYVDTLSEAKRIFVENLTSTLQVIAKDAKFRSSLTRKPLVGFGCWDMKTEDSRMKTSVMMLWMRVKSVRGIVLPHFMRLNFTKMLSETRHGLYPA